MDVLAEIYALQRKYDNPQNAECLKDFLLFFTRYNKNLQEVVKSERSRLKKERILSK